MPSQPTFDYYAELEIERSASPRELTSSYRRLALVHHPDRNPDNKEEATSRFQRLQLAYETLSDPAQRADYDLYNNTAQTPLSCSFTDDDNLQFPTEATRTGFADWTHIPRAPFQGFPTGGYPRGSTSYERRDPRQERRWRQAQRDEAARESRRRQRDERRRQGAEEAYQEHREAVAAREYRRRQREQRSFQRMEELLQRQKELVAEAEKIHQLEEERRLQEKMWKDLEAFTNDERLTACLHSAFYTNIPQRWKVKCTICSGMIGFECPHCSALICQSCLTITSADKWKNLDKAARKNTRTFDEGIDDAIRHSAAHKTEAPFMDSSWPEVDTCDVM
ncbi:hypothetical protein VPNG_06573 [Cytospora leucostoma]|uniref:J domain-containing protein n=1 Tax=Cytospora leucostoma TaxID=1230097 RepID=A0A423X2H8_9PEZI|nr:hypothetical protein VPNG_06573 [Cytospora leucostoma]